MRYCVDSGKEQLMTEKIYFGNSVITYYVTKSNRRKTSQIIVSTDGIEVKTPVTKKDSEIKKMVLNKSEWIFKKQLELSVRKKQRKVKTKSPEYLEKRTWELASKIGVRPSRVVIKKMTSRWGSAGKTGTIALNHALTETPLRIIDYVIIHELCHLKIRNHSKQFWDMLYSYDREFESKMRWLNENIPNC